MDADRFDTLTTHLSAYLTRRRGLGVLAAGGLGATLLPETAAAKKKKRKNKNKNKNTNPTPPPPVDPCPLGSRLCQGNCLPDEQCCTDADCGAYETCTGGSCLLECPAETHFCNGECLANGYCCTDADCPGGRPCVGYFCEADCPLGERPCRGECIPQERCCADADCEGGQSCLAGICDRSASCLEQCGVGRKCVTCTERAGAACADRAFCDSDGSYVVTHSWFADGCTGSPNTFTIGSACKYITSEPGCTSDASCPSGKECVWIDCCGKATCQWKAS